MILALVFAAAVATPVPGGQPPEVELTSFELTAFSKQRSEGRAVLAVRNRDTVPIPGIEASCKVRVNGQEVGGGAGKRGKVRPGKRVALEMVFYVDHDRFEAAAGNLWVVGASVDAEMEGTMRLLFPSGEVAIPLKISRKMGTDGARSGVFSHPMGR